LIFFSISSLSQAILSKNEYKLIDEVVEKKLENIFIKK
jgi:hypothetical protein